MRRQLAASLAFSSLLLVSQTAPANFSPKISDVIELEQKSVENDKASQSHGNINGAQATAGEDVDKSVAGDSAKGATRLSSLERARLALAKSEAVPPSQNEICTALVAVARQHSLPVGFFTNLIWQESRFGHTAISPVGAMGIAQFMPDVADALSLDPFEAREALPASGKLLTNLRVRFGNLGLVAAAYNAGPKRVADWLAGRSLLPNETRDYVNTITGRPVEQWRATSLEAVYQIPKQVPCHRLPAFVSVVQAERTLQLERIAEERRTVKVALLAAARLRDAAQRKGKQVAKRSRLPGATVKMAQARR